MPGAFRKPSNIFRASNTARPSVCLQVMTIPHMAIYPALARRGMQVRAPTSSRRTPADYASRSSGGELLSRMYSFLVLEFYDRWRLDFETADDAGERGGCGPGCLRG